VSREIRPDDLTELRPVPTAPGPPRIPVSDLVGIDLAGQPVRCPLAEGAGWTLLLFLTGGCLGCVPFFAAAGDPVGSGLVPEGTAVVVVGREGDPTLADLVRPGTAVVQTTAGWDAYRVLGPPFFVLVGGVPPRVATEGVAWGVDQVAGHLKSAMAGADRPEVPRLDPRPVDLGADGH
jgi:hypothetical protein